MARFHEPTPEQKQAWDDWVKERPPHVRAVAERFDPWTLYRLTSSGHRVSIYSFSEDGTLTVVVLGRFNKVAFERRVFGIKPEDLTECDLPDPDEELGSDMDQDELEDNLDLMRVRVRPDLWELDETGKAVRRYVQ